MKNSFVNPPSIEKQDFRKEKPYVIIDGNGVNIAEFSKLYDAAICLRFIIGKSMSRLECDLAESLLKQLDDENGRKKKNNSAEGAKDNDETE